MKDIQKRKDRNTIYVMTQGERERDMTEMKRYLSKKKAELFDLQQ